MRELKKIRIKRISIVSSPATTRLPWIMTKSMDDIQDDDFDIGDLFPLVVPAHLIQKWEEQEALEEMQKQELIDAGANPDDPLPSLPILIPSHLLKDDDEDDEDE